MNRHTTFKFCLDPNDGQQQVLARHAGASRLAFNQCLRMVKTALTQRETDPDTPVPWTGFDLINTFNKSVVRTALGDERDRSGTAQFARRRLRDGARPKHHDVAWTHVDLGHHLVRDLVLNAAHLDRVLPGVGLDRDGERLA